MEVITEYLKEPITGWHVLSFFSTWIIIWLFNLGDKMVKEILKKQDEV